MTDPLTLSLTVSPEASDSTVADETVILHLGNDTYFGLDPVGTIIWEDLKEGVPLERIRDRLMARFDLDRERVEADMRAFLGDLLKHDILVAG